MEIAAIVFIILLALGMPVAFSIGIAGLAFFLTTPEVPLSILTQNIVSPSQNFTMLAIPLFVFAGNLMNATGITSRMIVLANTVTGHMYGNIAQVSTVLSTLMAGVSGSANADAAMQARILGPEMNRRGYNRGYSAAVVGVTSMITATIPPSMGLILYGSVGEVSIGRLFAAGFVPGILMMVFFMIVIRWTAKKRGYVPQAAQHASLGDVGKALLSGIWALLFPIILIVGIRFGLFTPSESGAFACMYAIFVGTVIYREMTWKRFIETLKNTTRDIGIIMILISMSGAIGYGVVYDQVPQTMSRFLIGVTENQYFMVFLIILFLLTFGMFVESTVVVLLMTPILLPAALSVGVDPVQFGLIMMTVTTMGIMTPPVGIALFTTSSIIGTTPEQTAKESIPFIGVVLAVVAIMVFFPEITLFIPNMIFGN